MEGLPVALLGEIVRRLSTTSDLNSLSLVSKQLYVVEAELRDAVCIGSGNCPVAVALARLCSRFPNLRKVEFNYSGSMPNKEMESENYGVGWFSLWAPNCYQDFNHSSLVPNHGMQLDNHGLNVFSSCCPSLTHLTLSFCWYIDDSGLGLLARFKKLMSLTLNTLPEITSSGLLSLVVGCKTLSVFHLVGCQKVDCMEWLEYLGKSGSLEELVVKNCRLISQFDLLKLGPGWMKLKKFEFQRKGLPNAFDPRDPLFVARNQYRYDFCCESLEDLTLARIATEQEIGLRYLLSKCKALKKLCLYYVHGLKDSDMITLSRNCNNLRSISLWLTPQFNEGRVFRTSLTDDTLKALALRCPLLQSFELIFLGCDESWPEIGFTQEGLVLLVQSCPISDLVLNDAHIFNDMGMKALSSAQYLETLELWSCNNVTDAGMRFLARSPRLNSLTLRLCHGFTDDGVGEVVRAGKLESLIVEGCFRVSLKAVQGGAKSVHYDEKEPTFLCW